MSFGDSTRNDGQSSIGSLTGKLVATKGIHSASSDCILLEGLQFKQLDKILDGRMELTTDTQFLQCNDYVLSTFTAILAVRENVTGLRVGIPVGTTSAVDREVSPNVRTRTEV